MKWIYIYGPPRTGSTYLLRQIRKKSIHSVSDWGLGMILKPFCEMPGGIDKDQFLKDLSKNLLCRSHKQEDAELDLVLKAANSNHEEFQCYMKMFGSPHRVIFTIREPSGYMNSAMKKFPEKTTQFLQDSYLRMLQLYSSVGGEILNYSDKLNTEIYQDLLLPLKFTKEEIEPFEYKGRMANEAITQEMEKKYDDFLKENHQNLIHP